MTEDERAALAEELAEAMGLTFGPGDVSPGPNEIAACLPIIERLLAERDIDALLDGVGGGAEIDAIGPTGDPKDPVGCWIKWPGGTDEFGTTEFEFQHGTGPKRMDALRDAVAAAKGERHE